MHQVVESGLRDRLVVAPEVADALRGGRPVVALKSTLISHGLPFPLNLDAAGAAEAAVRDSGAVPATVAIRDGRLLVGLDGATLVELATVAGVRKVARSSLAAALAAGGLGATTVSATMLASGAAGFRVFATGGIGGVHRGAFESLRGTDGHRRPPSLDVSGDLEELARSPVVVVCAGPKAILDVAGTLEVLESRGVPVVAVGTDELPGFFCRSSGVPCAPACPGRGGGSGPGPRPPGARARIRRAGLRAVSRGGRAASAPRPGPRSTGQPSTRKRPGFAARP